MRGLYRGDTLDSQGFIHSSTPDQIIRVANRLFRGNRGMVLLCIDSEKVREEIRYEDAGEGDRFPHIYGPLNTDAVVRVLEFEPSEDGTFKLPREIAHIV